MTLRQENERLVRENKGLQERSDALSKQVLEQGIFANEMAIQRMALLALIREGQGHLIERLHKYKQGKSWDWADWARIEVFVSRPLPEALREEVERFKKIEEENAGLREVIGNMTKADQEQHERRIELVTSLLTLMKKGQILLTRISQWDHMDTAGDGPYWRKEIEKYLDLPLSTALQQAGEENKKKEEALQQYANTDNWKNISRDGQHEWLAEWIGSGEGMDPARAALGLSDTKEVIPQHVCGLQGFTFGDVCLACKGEG